MSAITLERVARQDGAILTEKRNIEIIFTSHVDGKWPPETKELCLYCLHPFKGVPAGYPVSFDEKTKMYRLRGFFCSWSCAEAFLLRDIKNDSSYHGRGKLNLFYKFIENVLGQDRRTFPHAPPLEHLCHLAAVRSSIEEAVAEWRSDLCAYKDCRPVENLFIPVAQVFELRLQRERSLLRQARAADRLNVSAKSLVETKEGQKQQTKVVKQIRKEREQKRMAIDELLGIKKRSRK